MSELRWEEPPYRRTRGPGGKHAAIAEQLKARPGEWAVIDTFDSTSRASSMAYTIKRAERVLAYAPAGSFEAVARTVDGEHRLYVRYVGEKTDE